MSQTHSHCRNPMDSQPYPRNIEIISGIENGYQNEDVKMAGNILQIQTYTRRSWPLGREELQSSISCDTYCIIGYLVIRSLLSLRVASIVERLAVELQLPDLTTQIRCDRDSKTQPSAWEAKTLTNCATARAVYSFSCYNCNCHTPKLSMILFSCNNCYCHTQELSKKAVYIA